MKEPCFHRKSSILPFPRLLPFKSLNTMMHSLSQAKLAQHQTTAGNLQATGHRKTPKECMSLNKAPPNVSSIQASSKNRFNIGNLIQQHWLRKEDEASHYSRIRMFTLKGRG
jgi:hypothetical protein